MASSSTNSSLFSSFTPASVEMPIISRKRRPIDPPEEGTLNNVESYAQLMPSPPTGLNLNQRAVRADPPKKRMRTVNNFLESLSLSPADPPGHYNGLKNHDSTGTKLNVDEHIDQIVHFNPAPTDTAGAASCASTITTANKGPILNQPIPFEQQQFTTKKQEQYRRQEQSTSGFSETGSSEMSLEGSEIDSDSSISSSSVGSVSESSIRNAMYQVVFGRRNGNSCCVGGSSNYNIVDCKIEDLIRRSRMEAVIKCKKEKGQENWTDGKNGDGKNEMDLD